jgi:hypothetical protein
MSTEFPASGHFFGAYMMQDWDLQGEDWPQVVDKYLREHPSDEVAELCDELAAFIASPLPDADVEALLDDLGLGYYVELPQLRAWLAEVRDRLLDAQAHA